MLDAWYESIGGDYKDAFDRIKDDSRILRFLLMFPNDDSMNRLSKAMGEEDWREAFEGAHSLKGVSQTLSLKKLGDSASRLTDFLRENKTDEAKEEYKETLKFYYEVIEAIERLR